MRERESYVTYINKRKYVFDVKWDGHIWIARAFYNDSHTVCEYAWYTKSAEAAALLLVETIEKKYK